MNVDEAGRLKQELAALYNDLSRHSVYQSVPDFVASATGYQVAINEEWRGDRVRWRYLAERLSSPALVRWCDVGANTGFFSLTLAHDHPSREVLAVEANPNHARFIERIRDAFALRNLAVSQQAVDIDGIEKLGEHDVLLHLNVLHHAGMDFDRLRVTGPGDFAPYARDYLAGLRAAARVLVFHMGSNLWGDKSRPLVGATEDEAKLRLFAGWLTAAGWRIRDVAYAARPSSGDIHYRPLPAKAVSALGRGLEAAVVRDALGEFSLDRHVGEFYRRPLFICTRPGEEALLAPPRSTG